LEQNLIPKATSAPQRGHFFMPNGAPQFMQNFPFPAGFPHLGHVVVRLSIFPVHTVALSAASSIFFIIADAFAFAT
jgi:hypothetical protein